MNSVSAPSPLPVGHAAGITERKPGDLKPWPDNPRTHSDKQLAKLKSSIQKFGFTAPLLVDEGGTVLSGHGRLQAALELGLPSVPTRVLAGLSEAKKRAYVIADNKLGEMSRWDQGLLKSEMELLIADNFEIEETGFSTAELDLMFEDPQLEGQDPHDLTPEDLEVAPVSRPGDLWQLGEHRILCGDALRVESYQALLQDERAQMVITDPPYNVPIDGHVCGSGKVKHKEFAMASGEMTPAQFTAFLGGAFVNMKEFSQDGAVQFIFMDWRHASELQDAAEPVFGRPRQLCVWAKDNAGMGSFYRSQHELVFVFKAGQAAHINNFELGQHGRYRTNVWNYPGVNTFKGKGYELLALHPTVKPVGLLADAIRDCSHRNGVILDPFGGSGTLLVAAERTSRRARVIEFEPQYVDVAIGRWRRVTGGDAVLVATGQTWDQVRAQRAA